jgi:hypothetical protein
VYARFVSHGARLQLLDPHAHAVRSLGAGAGLVAATAPPDAAATTWMVTGTDAAGVASAARALAPARLHDRFALAVRGEDSFALPQHPSS